MARILTRARLESKTADQQTSPPFEFFLPVLADRRGHFGFVHRWRANWFAFFDEPHFAMLRETGSSRDQVTHDHVFLEPAELVDFPERCCLGQHTGCVLE